MSLLAFAVAAGVSGADPLAPARHGMMQCYQPNIRAKTCQSLASYLSQGGRNYGNTALVMLSPKDDMTLETTTPVTVIEGAVCGAIRAEDIARGTLRLAGQKLAPEQATPLLDRISESMSSIIGKQICTTYEPSGEALIAKGRVDGLYRADMDQSVKWVSPSDGYTVAP
jgi:hypothetical protein